MNRLGAVAAFLVLRSFASAADATVSGRVLDFVYKTGIDGATIVAKITGVTQPRETVSGQDGSFAFTHIPLGKAVKIEISQLGYTPNPFTKPIMTTEPRYAFEVRLIPKQATSQYLQGAAREIATDLDHSTELLGVLAASNLSADQYNIVSAEITRLSETSVANTQDPRFAIVARAIAVRAEDAALAGQALTLGDYSLISVPAPFLQTSSTSLASGITSAGFVTSVGGVAFEQIAKPAAGFKAHSLNLEYVKGYADGERMVVTVNGQPATVQLHDWQLVPIAHFADSKDSACFALFGRLNAPIRERPILEAGGRILNYAAAFSDTLLGLRLFELDNLIIQDFAADLPKAGSRYILGAGEQPPNITSNTAGIKAFKAEMQRIEKAIDTDYRSYVISDLGRTIEFSVQAGKLTISGEPSYYFWRFYEDNADPHEINKLDAEIKAQQKANPAGFNEHTWLVDQLLQLASSWDGGRTVVDFDELLRLRPAERRKTLNSMDVDNLRDMLTDVRLERIAMKPVKLDKMSEYVSAHTKLLRAINPAIWDSATNVMRYSAFFRYVKVHYPAVWSAFVRQLADVSVTPMVKTPTVMKLKE